MQVTELEESKIIRQGWCAGRHKEITWFFFCLLVCFETESWVAQASLSLAVSL